jgi:hypothetical protein
MTNEISSDIAAATIPTPDHFLSLIGAKYEHVQPRASFVRFPLLPLELREQIWKYSLLSGRIIKVKSISLKDKNIFVEHDTLNTCGLHDDQISPGYVLHPMNYERGFIRWLR